MKKILPISLALLSLFSAGCEANNHDKYSKIQSSVLKGKNDMITQSPMLNEILSIKRTDIPRWEPFDVSHIVSKYLPIGSSREQVINSLNKMHQDYKEEDNFIYAGYFKQGLPLVPSPSIFIALQFNGTAHLEKIDATLNYVE